MQDFPIFRFGRESECVLGARESQVEEVELPAMIYVANEWGSSG
jgi:hypothetical protein